jgi:glycerol uptake facilitator-like aquaporin
MTETGTGSARTLTAEAIASFALIFIGAGAAIAPGVNHDTPAFAHGLTLLVIVAVLGDMSGGHLIPPSQSASLQRECFQGVSLHLTSRPARW